jgi:hypothetical protein
MGMHFVNFPLVPDGEIDATRPEIVIYEPLPNGRLRLVGADTRPRRRSPPRALQHERVVDGSVQELNVDERGQQRCTDAGVEVPQPLGLRDGHAQSRHFEKLALNAPQHLVDPARARRCRFDGILHAVSLTPGRNHPVPIA